MAVQVQPRVKGLDGVPRVSIIIPFYNSSADVVASLAELDRQSYRDREIILVDDGSTDETAKVAAEVSAGRKGVVVVGTEHGGPSHARNAGVQKAKGEIVFFAESDCVYDEGYLQKAVERLDAQPDAGAVCLTGAPLITRSTLATRCLDIENKVQHRLLDQGKIRPFYAWVYRTDVLKRLGGFDEKLFQGEDKDLFARLEAAHYGVAWVPGVNWRHRRDQTTPQLAKKWFTRGRTRVLYSLKQRRAADFAKTLIPFWTTILGVVLLVWSPLIGGVLILLVALLFVASTIRIMRVAWPVVEDRWAFVGYPLFVLTRNFSMAMGYSVALLNILVNRIRGKEIAWSSV